MITVLGRKKNTPNSKWAYVFHNIEKYISREEVENEVDKKVEEIKAYTKGKKCAIAWSGGIFKGI